ncbi:MAG: hypothetical protein VB070_01630 [Clostridiaceae bacterium]|nr:hypothetical protein [Clostridiaceae bacterium]
MNKMAIYNRLPVWGQNLACYYEGKRIMRTRYCKDFWRFLDEYESRDGWSYEQLCDYRDKKLRKMIHHCYETVPYYTKLFNDGGINPSSIKTLDDLKVLPVLTKDIVKANNDSLISSSISEKIIKIHPTGGTTGAGLNFRTTNAEEAEQWAVWWRYRRKHGIDINDWCGNFGGKTVVALGIRKPPYWRINSPGKQIFYSGYHLNEDTAPLYVDNLKKNNIQWIHGYPSNIANLAAAMNRKEIVLPLKQVSIGAENIYPYQVQQIKKAFGVTPIQHYGLTEGVANISENADGILVVDEDFCCVEFLNPNDNNEYHLVGTTLTNWAMPLLRYDTGDLALVLDTTQNDGHGRMVDCLRGRSNEYVLLPNGVKVGAAAISLILNTFQEINESQIRQQSNSSIEVYVVLNVSNDTFDEKKLLLALRERLGNELIISIKYVSNVEKTKGGKYRLVISEI